MMRRLMLVASLAASALGAQTRDLGGYRFQTLGEERIVYSAEANAAPRWRKFGTSIPVDSVVRGPLISTAYGTVRNNHFAAEVRVWRSRLGAVDSVTAAFTDTPHKPSAFPAMERDLRELSNGMIRGDIGEVCNAVILFAGAPARGEQRFSIRVNFKVDTFARQIQGTVTSRHMRDSVADGRNLYVVRDSTTLTEATSTPFRERTLFLPRVDERRLAGSVVGTRVYDASLELSVALADTTRLSGRETRRLPDGRTLTDNVAYELVRSARLLDSVTRRKESERGYATAGVGMVRRPPLGAQPVPDVRMPRVVDSLVERYRNTRNSATRDSVLAVRNFVYMPGNRERIARVHAEQGDTVGALRALDLDIETPLSEWSYNLVRPILDDPQLAMRMGIGSNELYEAFEYAFRYYPFSTPGSRVRGDSMEWCPPRVCALVAQEWTRARDPRLRYIGLMARYRMNPALYADTVVAATRAGAKFLTSISEQAQGVKRASSDDPPVYMPAAGAPWREWFVWMRGETDETHIRRANTNRSVGLNAVPGSPASDPLYNIQLSSSPELLRMAQLRLGVSFADTFRMKYAEASVDTAAYVYFTLLESLGARVPPRGDVIARLTARSAFERSLALAETRRMAFVTADTGTAREIESAMLDAMLDSAPLWPQLDSTRKLYVPIQKLTRLNETHIVADSLQPATVARLRAAGVDVQRPGWQLPNEKSGHVIRLRRMTRSGDFVVVSYESTWLVRLPNGAGGGDATGGSCLLVRVNGRWYLVDAGFWVT